jgi:hypothetical protein
MIRSNALRPRKISLFRFEIRRFCNEKSSRNVTKSNNFGNKEFTFD